MEHPTEYVIEQFVLNAPEIWGRELELSAHFSECESCSLLADDIRRFYADAASLIAQAGRPGRDPVRLPVRLHGVPADQLDDFLPIPSPSPPVTFSHHLLTVVRTHPARSLVSTFSILAAAVLATLLLSRAGSDTNPAYASVNMRDGIVTVLNRQNNVVFSSPWTTVIPNFADPTLENIVAERLKRQILVVHPPGASANVVVTSLNLGRRAWEDEHPQVRLVDGGQVELRTLPAPSGSLTFRGRTYTLDMRPITVVQCAETPEGVTEIATKYSGARSPHAIQRADIQGNILGTYWHFGQMDIVRGDLDSSGRGELLLYGVNDVDDYKRAGMPILCVLESASIVGECEASASRGFGLPVCAGERCYLSFPVPPAIAMAGRRVGVQSVARLPGHQWSAFVSEDPVSESIAAIVGYNAILDSSFRAVQIKPNTALIDLHRHLRDEGKLPPMTDAYLQALVLQVRYWDGEIWRNHPSGVAHRSSGS
jgi:hypothetical protein